jgi:hypothetical protein
MANVWIDPIFDRTLADVEFAIQKIEGWKKYHTHTVDVRVENDALILEKDAEKNEVDNDKFILQTEGAVYVHNGALILDIDDVYDLKGCLNLADLNRIEGNMAYIADKMEEYFFQPNIHYKSWTQGDLPNENDLSRILDNIRYLIISFYSPTNAPTLPTTMLSYNDINAIEENLYLLKELLDCLEKSFKKSGTITSGSTTFLPIRR